MATGQEMLIRSLARALGIDDAMLGQIKWMVDTVRSFDERLRRVETLCEIAAHRATTEAGAEFAYGDRPGDAGAGVNGTLALPGSGSGGGIVPVPGSGADAGKS